jgi:excisionase family DNA binding protein
MSDPLREALADAIQPILAALVEAEVARRVAGLAPVAAPSPDQWLTSAQAATYMQLTPAALRARVRRGRVRAHRDGRRLLFHRPELDAMLESLETN